MSITILYSLLISLIGLVIYALAPDTRPKLKEIGRLMFFAGLLAFCFQLRGYTISGGTP